MQGTMQAAGFSGKRVAILVISGILLVFAMVFSGMLFESVDAQELVVIQSVGSGSLHWFTSPGWKWQGFGTVTKYPRRNIYHFGVPVRFNDGGHGTMWGSIQFEMPLDTAMLTTLHKKFGSPAAIEQQLIQTVTNKSIYMTGPLMSSRESYAERRNDLMRFVEDQVSMGVYRTHTREAKTIDPLSNQEKTIQIVEIVTANGQPERQEGAVLQSYGLRTFNFAIDSLPYDNAVETQIKQQQQLTMQVQTSIAEARQAEQRAITAAKNGEATATEARWRQEAVKAESVTVAQRRLEQATLDARAAGQERQANILRGEGEATRRRLVMQADGALAVKIQAWVDVNRAYAENFAQYGGSWVPSVVMGGAQSGGMAGGLNGASEFINLLTMSTARQLGLDLTMPNRPLSGALASKDSTVPRAPAARPAPAARSAQK